MQKTTQDEPVLTHSLFRIGAVAKLTGIPVSTLRIWEVRHHAFSPSKTAGKHRLYSQEDVDKANLLKQLSRQGRAISTMAPLQVAALEGMLEPQEITTRPPAASSTRHSSSTTMSKAAQASASPTPLSARSWTSTQTTPRRASP